MEQSVNIKKEPLGNGFFINVSKNHTFGTDAVLLADFASSKKAKTHCDLGAGCGIVSMLLLRDNLVEQSVGVEISEEAVSLAKITAEEYADGRFEPLCADIKETCGLLPLGSYGLVTCNPPYKANGAGIKSAGTADSAARHETLCTMEDIISTASRLLCSSGRLCMCQRPERLTDMMDLMRKYRVEPKRLRIVCKKVGEEPWLFLLEGRRDAKNGLRIMPPLFIYDENGSYTSEMIKIYGPYKENYL